MSLSDRLSIPFDNHFHRLANIGRAIGYGDSGIFKCARF